MVVRRGLEPGLTIPEEVVAWRVDPPRQLAERLGAIRAAARTVYAQAA